MPHVARLSLIIALSLAAEGAGAPPSFENEVMPVLSKMGCNSGPCHGNLNGKGGFRLSLRGEDPARDWKLLVQEYQGRRINRFSPGESLLLRKATAQVAHEGGKRFAIDSDAFRTLRDWIEAGAAGLSKDTPDLVDLEVTPTEAVLSDPHAETQIKATAKFSDGSVRDVTKTACYDTSNMVATVDPDGRVRRRTFGETTIVVRFLDRQQPVQLAFLPQRDDFAWQSATQLNYIDENIDKKLQRLKLNPSAICDDTTFVRRAHLDTLGLLPTAEEARSFVDDTQPDKRARLIDELLQRPEFAELWALRWSDLLKNEEKVLDVKGVAAFHEWIVKSFAEAKPLDQFVRELILAKGSSYEQPAANYYRANRDAVTRAETTARLFLGTRLQCAKCHNHPFERWTQDDYYGWASFFARIDYKIVDNKRKDKFDKNEFVGEQIILVKDEGEVTNVRTGKNAKPRFLGGGEPQLDSKQNRLEPLATWLTSSDNRLFVQSQVNLIWYHMLGRGLVDPIDDFRVTNPASNEPLLDALCADFVAHKFDLRHMVRVIMNSRTYQLCSRPHDGNADDQRNFSRAIVRRLTAEQLLDAQSQVLDLPAEFVGYDKGLRAGQIPGVRKVRRRKSAPLSGDRFLQMFGKPDRTVACECARSNETALGQAFMFICDDSMHKRLSAKGGRIERLANSSRDDRDIVEELFWVALSRPPTAQEEKQALGHIADCDDRFEAMQDVAWAVMNAKEFVFRH